MIGVPPEMTACGVLEQGGASARRRVRVLINSHAFAPSIGGSESACVLLVDGLLRRGYEVSVVTQTPSGEPDRGPFSVFRRPSPAQLLELVRWADVVVHSNISLRATWPLLIKPKPWVIVHHSTLIREDGRRNWLKLFAALFATNIAVSESMAESLLSKSIVLGNGYRDQVFRLMPSIRRDANLIFVGRLVSSKGADLVIRVLAELRREGFLSELTVVGEGPCEGSLRELAQELGIGEAVRFAGNLPPEKIARLLNGHRLLLAPSKGVETFGLVALEALACGCMPVVSAVGGLPETVGLHGVVIPEGDLGTLTEVVRRLLRNPQEIEERLQSVGEHLERFREERVIETYVEVIESAYRKRRPRGSVARFSIPLFSAGQDLLTF